MESMTEAKNERMGRGTALGILARIAQKRKTTLDEVIALQMAVRCIAKRMFDWERRCKRKREEGGPATALPDADGAEAANGQTVQRPNGQTEEGAA